jgi:nitrogen regulatory protein P-II 1
MGLGIPSSGRSLETMLKIDAVIHPFKLEDVKATLQRLGIGPILISEVREYGGLVQQKAFYRGAEYCADIPKVKLEMLVSSLHADEVIEELSRAARTTLPGDDGTILVYEVADGIRIRSGSRIQYALA